MTANKHPPTLAEGSVTFTERAGGDFIICEYANGAALMLSRHDMIRTAHQMLNYSKDSFAEQPAAIITFAKEAKA